MTLDTATLVAIAPFALAVLLAVAVLVVDLAWPGNRTAVMATALGGLAIVAAATVYAGQSPTSIFGGSYTVDALTTFLDLVFIGIVAFTLVFAPDSLEPRGLPLAEFAIVLVFAMTGAMLISAAGDLLVLFIALELMVLPGYMLAGYHKTDGYSTEGAIKYFLLGSFSSAIFLFGLAFVWGLTGTTNIAEIAGALRNVAAGGPAAFSPGLALGLG